MTQLQVQSVDWHLPENTKAHHTDRYEIVHEKQTPVLRRAQPFILSITFNRSFNEKTDKVRLFFTYGNDKLTPRLEALIENTTVSSSNKVTNSKHCWSLEINNQSKNTIKLLVRSAGRAAWGLWNLMIKTSVKTSPHTDTWKSPLKFYLIYNPWSQDDDVYMPATRYLDEYILNDVGKIFTSSSRKPIGMKWIFGQFSSSVLQVIDKLLCDLDLDEETLGDPVQLCVNLARSVGNIVEGNWSGSYEDGTAPWLWTGSIPIYDEYLKREVPVKYAQCFIYSGIFTTALRAVGIPARSVTNFISATGGEKMSVNYVFNKNGEAISVASIWNFHVWNDAWMSRYDLSPGYGGWQAADATNYVGPAPVQALKKGEICLNYNCRDILGEINADRVRWTKDENGEYHLINIDTKHIGRALLTKQPFIYDPHGDTDFEDVLQLYKEPEGSKEERMTLYNAIKHCKAEDERDEWSHDLPYHIDVQDNNSTITFQINEIEYVIFGQTLEATVNIQNKGDLQETVECCVGASSMYYNGANAGLIRRQTKIIKINPKSNESFTVKISGEDYAAKLVEFTQIKIHAIATVQRTNFTWADDFITTIEMPEISISSKNVLEVNKEGVILFEFENILRTKLTDCYLTYEAPGIGRNVKIRLLDIEASEDVIIEHKITPNVTGEIIIKAIFTSKQLNYVSGTSTVQVL